jgi:hypothetical protein
MSPGEGKEVPEFCGTLRPKTESVIMQFEWPTTSRKNPTEDAKTLAGPRHFVKKAFHNRPTPALPVWGALLSGTSFCFLPKTARRLNPEGVS